MNTTRTIEISNMLKELGVAPNIRGYHYLRYAIELAMDDMSVVHNVVKELYLKIAKNFDSTKDRVERCMRHAIETAWLRADVDTLNAMFGHTVQVDRGKPTNSEFIATVADHLLMTRGVKA